MGRRGEGNKPFLLWFMKSSILAGDTLSKRSSTLYSKFNLLSFGGFFVLFCFLKVKEDITISCWGKYRIN